MMSVRSQLGAMAFAPNITSTSITSPARTDGSELKTACLMIGCTSLKYSRGLCERHYKIEHRTGRLDQWPLEVKRYNGVECGYLECTRNAVAFSLCNAHYAQLKKGRPLSPISSRKPCFNPRCTKTVLAHHTTCKGCSRVKSTYSLTDDAYLHLMSNYVCANLGCGATENLHIDHDHACCVIGDFPETYKRSCGMCVRGWLCSSCNTSLGLMQENPERIRGLLMYLESSRV